MNLEVQVVTCYNKLKILNLNCSYPFIVDQNDYNLLNTNSLNNLFIFWFSAKLTEEKQMIILKFRAVE